MKPEVDFFFENICSNVFIYNLKSPFSKLHQCLDYLKNVATEIIKRKSLLPVSWPISGFYYFFL